MKKLLPRCVALVSMIGGSAMAADMPLKAPIYKPAPSIVYDWTGFYVGGNVGYSIGRDPSVPFFGPPTGDQVTLAPRGGLAGLRKLPGIAQTAAGRNERRFLLQTYRRDMGGGQRVLMKDLSAPITVQGRHWGGLRLAYSF